MFDLGRLRLLRELSHRGTMTAVAAASRLTPSAVSQQLATLEVEAGVKLFEPTGRRVKLTAAGLRLVAHAETILNAVEAARVDMGIVSAEPSGGLEIGCFGTFAKAHVVPAIVRARSRHPNFDVILHELEPEDAVDAVRIGRCDAAIVYTHSLVPRPVDKNFVSRTLVDEAVVLALPAGLRALPANVELTEFANCDWIGGARGSGGYELTSRACAIAGFAPRITHSIDDYELLLRMVSSGLGVSFVPAVALALYPDTGVTVRTPAGPALRRTIDIITRPAVASSPTFVSFLAELPSASAE
ncbi:LysR family transcriptional regulator [Bosea caraganae]|uniref:LysR family transcriptional regulator n=1 Tax=Bosea caraganae TaxID=2763117 RepID=A0A370KZB3_9HYPH|nr:LysR substrate-binding domain-containing protein [Bosea caraganae]RDJ20317.1 LysR family transcriptional regulator [Bosea caraganae]RDJ24013.1 LysR family transcriptional regulator [Bosea caraganae]